LEDNRVAQYNIVRMGLEDVIRPAGRIDKELPVYITFSPKTAKSRSYARLIVEGVKKLRQSGKLEKILSNYGIDDWARDKKKGH
jgi:polar amino acid transport system substrate-binding protein